MPDESATIKERPTGFPGTDKGITELDNVIAEMPITLNALTLTVFKTPTMNVLNVVDSVLTT